MSKRKPLTLKDYKIVKGGTFGTIRGPNEPDATFPIRKAISLANEADDARRRDKPTREELIEAMESNNLIANDQRFILDILKEKPLPDGRPPDSKNASMARDLLMYIEYGKHLGKGLGKLAAKKKTARTFDVNHKTVEAAITRARTRLLVHQ